MGGLPDIGYSQMANIKKNTKSNLDVALFGISLDQHAAETLQAQLIDALRAIILADPAHAGLRLPASRRLAEELSVSRTTVQTAYDQLLSEGYLSTRQGSGTFVASNLPHLSLPPIRRVHERPPLQPWRPFDSGIPDASLFPHRIWARHLEKAWHAPETDLLARPDPFGWHPLREAISDHLSAWRGLQCHPEQVVITSGAWEAFEIIFRGLLNQHASIALEDPAWPTLRKMLATTGITARSLRIDDQGLNPAQIPKDTSAVIVTPSRHYPTGVTMPLARRAKLLDWATQQNGLIIEDDYDSEFRYKGQPLPSLCGLDGLHHSIYMGSFSKLLSPVLRIGYLVLPETYLPLAQKHLKQVGPRASLIPQPALATFMNSGEFAVHLRRMRRIYAKRQHHLISELSQADDLLHVEPDPSGMHIYVRLRPKLARKTTDTKIEKLGRRDGLTLRALSPHSVLPNPPQGLLLGYAAFDELALTEAAGKLIEILSQIKAERFKE